MGWSLLNAFSMRKRRGYKWVNDKSGQFQQHNDHVNYNIPTFYDYSLFAHKNKDNLYLNNKNRLM